MINNSISDSSTSQFLLPKVPNISKRSVGSSLKSNGSSDSGADTSDSSDDKSLFDLLRCSFCPYITNELSFYIYHLKTEHGTESLHCINCSAIFSVDCFQRHLSKCKGSHICEYCSATFAQKSYLQRHISRVHSKTNNKYVCDICGQILSTNNNLKQHKLIHSENSQFICEYCNKGFIQKIHYNTHLDNKHSKLELANMQKPYICCICSEKFIFQTSLQQHMTHCSLKREKRNCCSVCSKSFIYPSELRRHEHVHLSKFCRLYPCSRCHKTFNRLYQFIEHQFFHENVSAFKCPKCGKILSELSYVKKHYQRHFIAGTGPQRPQSAAGASSSEVSAVAASECGAVASVTNQCMDDDQDPLVWSDHDDENSLLIDRFIEEIWDRFYPYLDDEKLQSISFNDLKLDVWEEFGGE